MELFDRLAQSKFRSGFYLKEKDKAYAADKGREKIEKHAQDFIRMRLAPAVIPNDGKQTPMKGHPVFWPSMPALLLPWLPGEVARDTKRA